MPEFDYDFVAELSDDKQGYALSDKEVAVLLTDTIFAHIPARWNKPTPTPPERDNIDTWASGAESGLLTPVSLGTDELSPFWDDPDAADADGEPTDNTYTWSERIEDWAIAAFVATSGVPGAAVAYLTIAPRFRLYFKTRDFGGIVRILIDDVIIGEVDTYSADPGLTSFDVLAEMVT